MLCFIFYSSPPCVLRSSDPPPALNIPIQDLPGSVFCVSFENVSYPSLFTFMYFIMDPLLTSVLPQIFIVNSIGTSDAHELSQTPIYKCLDLANLFLSDFPCFTVFES